MKPGDEVFSGLDVPAGRTLRTEKLAALKTNVLHRIGPSGSVDPKAPSATRFRMARHRLLVPVMAAVIFGASAGSLTTAYAVAGSGAPSASPESLTTISTEGTPVPLTSRLRALPDSTAQAFLMATLGPTAYFRVPLADGGACFYTGRATDGEAYELGAGSCWTPAPRFPILDLSPIQASGSGGFQVLQIQGFAADGVSTIAVKDLDGNVIAEAAVHNNVYKITAYPPGGVSELVGLDDGDHVVQRITYSR
ncbi:MAG TPA: hypothetical protein VK488_01625 [Gaiellaceae bacterium]|nr:hypothetical protein [Gaiellaceae bacterium]